MNKSEKIIPGGRAEGTISVPGDKSISIRAVLFSALAEGISRINGLSNGEDVLSAVNCINQLGIDTDRGAEGILNIIGKGKFGFKPTNKPIDCGNSGTTLRLLTGILAGQKNQYILTGDSSLRNRPMGRILTPLRMMGARIKCLIKEDRIPYCISPSELNSISYSLPVASAQVKSAVLLAGLFAQGVTMVIEPVRSRNHTELMLSSRGVSVISDDNNKSISIDRNHTIYRQDMSVPGDISSAAFFVVQASLLSGSRLIIKNVGINSTRTGVITVLKKMGADIKVRNHSNIGGENTADLEVCHAKLHGVEIRGEIIPSLIDEIPILAVAGAFAGGQTIIRDASELRVKETDRISAVCSNLKSMGASVKELEDGLIIHGGSELRGAKFHSFGDHRIAMAFAVAAAVCRGESVIKNSHWADISFPGFYSLLNSIRSFRDN